jgi:hypothetical protein
MDFLFRLMNTIECRECPADMKSIGIFAPVHMQALLVAPAAGIQVFIEGFQLLHDSQPALFAEIPDTLKGLAVNQYLERVNRAWGGRTSVWLDDDPDDGSNGSICTATAANKRSAGAGRIREKTAKTLILIDLCTYMYSRMRERRAWTAKLRVAAGVPVFSALLPMIRQILCI